MQFKQLQDDMIAAMKARDKVRKDSISVLVSAAKKVAIDEGCRDDITEEIVDRVILKEIKSVKEQLDSCPESREDLRSEYQARYDIFMEYAPQMMTAEEVLPWSRLHRFAQRPRLTARRHHRLSAYRHRKY